MARPPAPVPLPPDDNIGPTLMALTGVLTAVALITSAARLWVRFSLRALGWDDYTMILVNFLAIARMSVQAAQVSLYGNGRHRWYLSESDYTNNNMLGWYAQILLFASICFLKVSILILIMRLKDEKRLRRLLYGVIAGLFITNFGSIIILIAECSPPSVYWTGTGGTCWDTRIRIYAIYCTIGFGILTDILCSLLPLYVVWRVRMKTQLKVAVCSLMSLGLIATGFGVARAASLGLVTVDLSWDYAISAIWSNLELFLGIAAANLALMRSIYAFFFNKKSTPTSSQSTESVSAVRLGRLRRTSLRLRGDAPARVSTIIAGQQKVDEHSVSAKQIHKRTEFSVHEEHGEMDSE